MLVSEKEKKELYSKIKKIVEYSFIEYKPDVLKIKVKSINSEQLEKIAFLLRAVYHIQPEDNKKSLDLSIKFTKKPLEMMVSNARKDIFDVISTMDNWGL